MIVIDGTVEDQGEQGAPEVRLVKGFYAGLAAVLEAVVKGEKVTCAMQGESEAVKAPVKLVMLDVSNQERLLTQ